MPDRQEDIRVGIQCSVLPHDQIICSFFDQRAQLPIAKALIYAPTHWHKISEVFANEGQSIQTKFHILAMSPDRYVSGQMAVDLFARLLGDVSDIRIR